MSVSTLYAPFSPVISPMAMPAAGVFIGPPPSMNARQAAHTEAMLEEPFDERISDTIRIVYGNISFGGNRGSIARSASAPWPISRLPGPRMGFTSPTENGGKL